MRTINKLKIEACGLTFKDAAHQAGKLLDWMSKEPHTRGYTVGHERGNAVGNWSEEPADNPLASEEVRK